MIPYFGLASGFLTGKYRSEKDLSKSVRGQRLGKYLDGRGLKILSALDRVAARHDAKPAEATRGIAHLVDPDACSACIGP